MNVINTQRLSESSSLATLPKTQRNPCWTKMPQALADPSLDPLFWRPERLGVISAWWEHVPLADWVVCATAPRVLVELGTFAGVSYTAFCEAMARASLATRRRFGAFSTLLQCTFDEALGYIEDASVDLLHIDGLHTYQAVCHDFDSWLPKLSDRAVVLFHNINVRHDDFGVWRLWAELRQRYPGFDFVHGYGLGVLAVGAGVPASVAALCELTDAAAIAMIRSRFAQLGERRSIDKCERLLAQDIGQRTAVDDQLRAEVAGTAARPKP